MEWGNEAVVGVLSQTESLGAIGMCLDSLNRIVNYGIRVKMLWWIVSECDR